MLIQDSAVVACASKSAGDTRMARMWAKELNKSAKTILATNYCVLWAGPRVKALDRRVDVPSLSRPLSRSRAVVWACNLGNLPIHAEDVVTPCATMSPVRSLSLFLITAADAYPVALLDTTPAANI